MHLLDRIAIVTGSTRGIGLAVAQRLAAEGAKVVINGRDPEATAQALSHFDPANARAVVGSAADPETATQLLDAADQLGETIDILINCAGTAEPVGSSILNVTDEDWHALIDAHLHSAFRTCRAVAPRMVEQGHGAIVNTSSHAFTGTFGGTGYPAGKGAVNSLTYALAAELKEHGVRVNAVCPGAKTRLSTGQDYLDTINQLHERGILDDLMHAGATDPAGPEHVAATYVFLGSDLASGITGQVLSASGGYVGRFAHPAEEMLAYRDHGAEGPYTLEELAKILG